VASCISDLLLPSLVHREAVIFRFAQSSFRRQDPAALISARFWSGLVSGFLTAHRNLVPVLLLSWTSKFDSDFHLVSVD
jgi:hypothetical protein